MLARTPIFGRTSPFGKVAGRALRSLAIVLCIARLITFPPDTWCLSGFVFFDGTPKLLLNETHADSFGLGWVSVYSSKLLHVQLSGFGSLRTTTGCLQSCQSSIELLGAPAGSMLGLFDLTLGYGCTPFAVPYLISFLNGFGDRFLRIAVVASSAALKICQLVASAARFQRIRFFGSLADARFWLENAGE